MSNPLLGKRRHRLRLGLGCACLLISTASTAYHPRPHRVSLTSDPFIPSVEEAKISPNGEWIVWRQAGSDPTLRRLFSVRRWAGSTPIPLTPQVADGVYSLQFWISPDSRYVVFQSEGVKDGKHEAWSIPIDGSSDAVRLNPSVDWNPHAEVTLVLDRAVLMGYFNTEFTREVWSAPFDGSVAAVQLNPELAPGAPSIRSLTLPWSGPFLAFEADAENDGHLDLWLSPIDGSSPAQRLNEVPGAGPGVIEFSSHFNLDGSWILYSEAGATGQGEIWSAPVGSSGKARRISPPGSWHVERLSRARAGVARALVLADSDDDSREEIWCFPVEGPSAAAVQLAETADTNGIINNYTFFFDATEENAIFRGRLETFDRQEVWRAPVDGSEAALRVNPPVQHASTVYSFLYPPIDGESTAIIQGNYLAQGDFGIWKVAIDGSEPNVRLDVPPAQGAVYYPFGRSSTHVVYADYESSYDTSLWSVTSSLPVVPIRLSEPRPSPWFISEIRIAPSLQRVIYLGETDTPIGREIFAVPVDGPAEASVRLNPGLPEGGLVYESVAISPDSEGVLFLAEVDGAYGVELWISDAMIFNADLEEGNTSEWSSEQASQ